MVKEDQKFSSTVPRELVHRTAVSEVYLTGMERIGADRFALYAQWPRLHYFYSVADGQTEAAMVIETFRQATVYIAHRGYDVDLDSNFLLPELHLTGRALSRHDPSRPADLTLYCSATELKSSAGALTFMNVAADVSVDCVTIAEVQAGARIVKRAAYARYRGQRADVEGTLPRLKGVSPHLIGRTSETSVLLGAPMGHRQWQLNVDLSDPVFFDHYVDHIPGVALLEAARQTIALVTQRPRIDFWRVDASFHAMVELNSNAQVLARDVTPSDSRYDHWEVEIMTGAVLNTTIVALCRGQELPTAPKLSLESDRQNPTTKFADARS